MNHSGLKPPRLEVVSGDGAWIRDSEGKVYLDALSGLYCVNVGYGRSQLITAASKQMNQLAYATNWSSSHPLAEELARKIAAIAPGALNWIFYTLGGSESVESAWKLARQYHRLSGHPNKYKLVSREGAYHGTSFGALSATGITSIKAPFEPLVPGSLHVQRVYPFHSNDPPREHSIAAAESVATIIEASNPDTVAAVLVEPIQNSGGCLTPDPEYFVRLRRICDEYDVLLMADETITAWGRLGKWFGSSHFGFEPDVITTAKGITSGYIPFGAVIAAERIFAAFDRPGVKFEHGYTFGGHPVGAAVALANINLIEAEGMLDRVTHSSTEGRVGQMLDTWRQSDIVGEVRGAGYFFAIELVRDKSSRERLGPQAMDELIRFLPARMRELGIICRTLHRGAPVIQFAPPLTITDDEVEFLESRVIQALSECEPLVRTYN